MDCRIATTRTTCAIGAALLSALIGLAQARAQTPPAAAAGAPGGAAMTLSKACEPGAGATVDESPLPNVAAALKQQRKTLRILAMGAAPGRVNARGGGYTEAIEAMLERALKGIDVIMINRGVSGELAAGAAARMKNEVALAEPDLVLWQVGTNDALADVPTDEFIQTVKEQIGWLKAHKVDVVLVGLQFASRMRRDAHYIDIRVSLRRLAAQENVIIIRRFEAMQLISQAAGPEPALDELDRDEAGYSCLAQYVARAITLGLFAKNMPPRPAP
ncbi:MAG: SGNH/GDSL hydrolase family protein [Rhizobiales bacterium]|nr:SGNH/GDSL hydrolase family protein [Hyphomicrobiales bacterium]